MKRQNIFENEATINSALVLFNPDIFRQISAQICNSHNYQPQNIKKDIRTLSDAHAFFHDYYAQEKIKQEIIDLCLPHHNSSSKSIAWDLRCRAIHDKLENLTHIVRENKEFTQDDLADPWYLAATTSYSFDYNIYQESVNQSLLYIAIDYWMVEKAITILDNTEKLHFDYGFEQNCLSRVAEQREKLRDPASGLLYFRSFEGHSEVLLTIAEKLLKKGFDPNGHTQEYQHLPLFCAVQHADKELVQLLLEYGANPDLMRHDYFTDKKVNAFDLEPEKGWLQKIIDEVAANKNNQKSS